MKNNITKIWEEIYQEWFNIKKDFSSLQVPDIYDARKHFAVIVAQELTMNEVVTGMRKKFRVGLYREDLDANIIQNDRAAKNGDYIILFKKRIEADKELKNLSANQLKETGHQGITLMERLLLGILYFNKSEKRLDIINRTLCFGSRGSDGYVPDVFWYSGHDGLYVGWSSPDNAGDDLRSRAVVS